MRRTFGHEVEVQELQRAHLDLLSRAPALEQTREGQEPIDVLEDARVARFAQERGDEDEEGLGLDFGRIGRVEQIEEEVHVVFSVEDRARGWMQEEEALEAGQGGQEECVGRRGGRLAH